MSQPIDPKIRVPCQPGALGGKKFDPFKPQQPLIPGVSPPKPAATPAAPVAPQQAGGETKAASHLPIKRIALGSLAALLVVAGLVSRNRSAPSTSPSQQPVSETTDTAAPNAATPAKSLPVGPGPVASTDELTNAWSSQRFVFHDPLTSESVPAMLVRLPHGEYWAFSLREPFGNCELEYLTDLQKLQSEYHFRADHPMVTNPCKHTVYDLTQYAGGATNGGLVRGEIVQGPGIRPPRAIEIRTSGKQLIAERLE